MAKQAKDNERELSQDELNELLKYGLFVNTLDDQRKKEYKETLVYCVQLKDKATFLDSLADDKGVEFLDDLLSYAWGNFVKCCLWNGGDDEQANMFLTLAGEIEAALDRISEATPTAAVEQSAAVQEAKPTKGAKANITQDNAQLLKDYFLPQFKGIGNNNSNRFEGEFLPMLKTISYNAKDWARLAYIVFNSDKVNRNKKPASFADFRKHFVELLGLPDDVAQKMAGYKPNDLDDDKAKQIKNLFYYLS